MSRIIAAIIMSITFAAVVLYPQTIKNFIGTEYVSAMDW